MRSARLGMMALAVASLSCALVASKAELRLVRTMRYDGKVTERAEALAAHRTRYGTSGRLNHQVVRVGADIDQALWNRARGRGLKQRGVEEYLRYFPDGAHQMEARRRLDQLRYFEQRDQALQAAAAAEQRQAEERERQRIEAENERRRDLVRGGLEQWLHIALTMPQWNVSLSTVLRSHPPFRAQWANDPLPHCGARVCRQTVEAAYFFSQPGGTRLDRRLSLVRQVLLSQDRVVQLAGYYTGRGFVDWLEMGSTNPILEDSEENRELARDAMLVLVRGAVATARPQATEQAAEHPGELLRMGDDEIVISVREFPESYMAGAVHGFEVSSRGATGVDEGTPGIQ